MSTDPNWGVVGILVICAGLLANSYPSSFAYDWPIHTLTLGFGLAGASLIAWGKGNFEPIRQTSEDGEYKMVARGEDDDLEEPETIERSATYTPLASRLLKLLFVLATCALIARVELTRHIFKASECSTSTWDVYLPLMIALYDALRFQKRLHTRREEQPDDSIYDSLYEDFRYYLRSYKWRYVPGALILSIGIHFATTLWSGLPSTYICPLVGNAGKNIAMIQFFAFLMDCFIACVFLELSIHSPTAGPGNRGRGPVTWAPIFFATSIFWSIVGLVVFFAMPEWRDWLMVLSDPFGIKWLKAVTWQASLFSLVVVCSAYCILQFSAIWLVMILATTFTTVPLLKMIWSTWLPFPPLPARGSIWALIFLYLGWATYGRIRQSIAARERTGFAQHFVYSIAFIILIYPALYRSNMVAFHPIDLLIYEARLQHLDYAKYQTQSFHLEDAVAQYRRRYTLPPPPSFDIWYEYARNRSCLILDSYDQIYNDLLPWRSLPPEYIRHQTWEAISNPWTEASGISIRNGVASVMPNVIPTHRWMLEGIVKMIEPFQQYLPDMDLAFNINDESRVAIPYREMEKLKQSGIDAQLKTVRAQKSWSADRNSTWEPIPENPIKDTKFKNLSFRQTYHEYGSISCPPNSMARNKPIKSLERMCHKCSAPHSMGQFLSNWSYAADVCHQPDLANLHGFYLSPAAFKTANTMQPIFSQSKPHGYSDIVYPSAWNYMEKATYAPTEPTGSPNEAGYNPGFPDMPFEEKKNVLFWRGATSEGVADGTGRATWRGMARQRLVHLANNLTSAAYDTMTVFLPSKRKKNKYEYHVLSASDLKTLGLQTDIRFVDRIARCGGVDCPDQAQEFGLVSPSNFQSHWQYRYLFDLDGAGFSGRFLPFLKSKSLPFKSALFREWYDDRLTAWRHFVPIDLRFHDVFSVLAYFSGTNGTIYNGRRILMPPHLREGELIAEQGREWANKVLRKEDMEVYLFRLLLEWGRLTDDNRDELGYMYRHGDAHGL